MGSSISSAGGSVADAIRSAGSSAASAIQSAVSNVKVEVDVNVSSPASAVGANYRGTDNWRGGPTFVSERGDEAIRLPDGRSFVARGMQMLNLPRGTEIFPAAATDRLTQARLQAVPVAGGGNGPLSIPATSQQILHGGSSSSVSNSTTNNAFNLSVQSGESALSVVDNFELMQAFSGT